MARTFQVVFFDAAETLFHIKGSVAEIYLRHAVTHGFKQTPDPAFVEDEDKDTPSRR